MKPTFLYKTLESGSKLIRFDNLGDIYYFDEEENNPNGLGHRASQEYFRDRNILTSRKQLMIQKAQKELSVDKEFLDLVYKAKSAKRDFKLNKFGGNLSIPHYAAQNDKVFKKGTPGAKKSSLNMAFQVGTFSGGNYDESFTRILKTILMCQAMNISVSIDVFDSDTSAIGGRNGYVICNVAKSNEKINFRNILASSHSEFFSTTLFNGYSASGCQNHIGTFLPQSLIVRDLGPMYDVIGGNMLLDGMEDEQKQMVSKILKIGINGSR